MARGLLKERRVARGDETHLPGLCERICIAKVGESDEGFIALERMRHYGEERFNVEHEGKRGGNRL